MQDLSSELAHIVDSFTPHDGMFLSCVPGVHCIKFSQTKPRAKNRWRACLGIIAQGDKEIVLGRKVYRCGAAYYSVTPFDLPVLSGIASASPEKPFLAVLIDFDPLILSEVAMQLDKNFSSMEERPPQALFVGKASDNMLESMLRLGKLLGSPDDASVLGPLVVREIFYHLLKGENGPAIHQFVYSGSKMHKVSQAIHRLKSALSDDVDVSALAKAANMSRSAFFKHFKEMTSVSPIQYQKRLRLHEARRLMTDSGETAESSAYKVGYKSASQFSREYSRMFGDSPLRDALKIKKAGSVVD